ncbi:hypothetical protein NM688_g8882 [Phlebia brevispora]|uniref:Uncharacterized protein n=1 Tax=Phlebia brevispora TaxID=194682 RepID=A0ACC1RQG9_9APHY|nr:hypothetical protein NM688_g8882 [Phlebia brevispora]
MATNANVIPDRFKQLPIEAPPRTQILTSATFQAPPLDGSLTLPEIYDWHAEHSPEHPLFVYGNEEGPVHTITWAEAVRGIHRAGRIVRDAVIPVHTDSVPVVAILANSEPISYFTTLVGIMRAGFTAFPISPRNSPVAVAHLIQKTSPVHLVVGPEPAMQELAAAAYELIRKNGVQPPHSSVITLLRFKRGLDDHVVIMHSSGSTAFPKPIPWSNYRILLLSLTPYFGEQDLCGRKFAFHASAMYHAMGIMQTTWTASAGITLACLTPVSPAHTMTPEIVIRAATNARCDFMYCVPSFIESYAKNPEHVELLQSMRGVIFAGGPLAKDVGDELSDLGISIHTLYGMSEGGIITPFLSKPKGRDWEYFCFPGNLKPHLIPQDDGTKNVELVLTPSKWEVPCVTNTVVDGVGAYSTSDVLAPHPTKPGFWKVYGRVDDQIMHNNGEKTNPGPLEHILNQDPHVHCAVMFGRGRFNVGVVIEPKPEYRFDPADEQKLIEFRKAIAPTVEKMNEYAPQHSRLFQEMIVVTSPSKPFTYTAKNTPRRHAIIKEYEQEIEKTYAKVDESAQSDLSAPSSWTFPNTLDFVRAVVNKVLEREISDTDDLFISGGDR